MAAEETYMDRLNTLLERLVTSAEERDARRPTTTHVRPKAIPSRIFKIGENWPNFSVHFQECVKAAYGYTAAADVAALHAACLAWLPSKLEPGPTLTAYKNVAEADKATWTRLNNALKTVFSDETEREIFLADVASFKKGKRSLLEYRTELTRLMDTHQPELQGLDTEFQRQITSRFIEGLENDELKRELRKECKRDRNNLDEAYNRAVDWEAAEVQTSIREGKSAVLSTEGKSLSVIEKAKIPALAASNTPVPNNVSNPPVIRKMQSDIESIASKQKISEMHIQELMAKNAHTADRVDTVSKEVNQMSERMMNLEKTVDQRFNRLEQLLTNNASQTQSRPNNVQQYNAQPYTANAFNNYRPYGNRGQSRGNYRGPAPQIRPSLTGGPGFADRPIRPTVNRMQTPDPHAPAATSTSEAQAGTPSATSDPSGGNAAAAAFIEHPRADPATQCYDEAGWWSPAMQQLGAMGYDDTYDGAYSYGGQDFWSQ